MNENEKMKSEVQKKEKTIGNLNKKMEEYKKIEGLY